MERGGFFHRWAGNVFYSLSNTAQALFFVFFFTSFELNNRVKTDGYPASVCAYFLNGAFHHLPLFDQIQVLPKTSDIYHIRVFSLSKFRNNNSFQIILGDLFSALAANIFLAPRWHIHFLTASAKKKAGEQVRYLSRHALLFIGCKNSLAFIPKCLGHLSRLYTPVVRKHL